MPPAPFGRAGEREVDRVERGRTAIAVLVDDLDVER
jgi:hypothetical protein